MQVVHIWCICCILNIIRFTVKSIYSLLHVSFTSAVNEAKMKRTKIFRLEVWDESVWQHLIGDKSIRQAEKNPSGNIWQIHVASWKVWRRRIGGGKFATKLPQNCHALLPSLSGWSRPQWNIWTSQITPQLDVSESKWNIWTLMIAEISSLLLTHQDWWWLTYFANPICQFHISLYPLMIRGTQWWWRTWWGWWK